MKTSERIRTGFDLALLHTAWKGILKKKQKT